MAFMPWKLVRFLHFTQLWSRTHKATHGNAATTVPLLSLFKPVAPCSYPLFVRADVAALAAKVRAQEQEQEKERLGPEEYERQQKLGAARKVRWCRR